MKKLTAGVLALCFIAMPIAADKKKVEFKDINEVEWAKQYIEKVAEMGIVKGYEDNEFKPNNKVTKCNALLMMYRTLKHQGVVDDRKEARLADEYKNAMDKRDIPTYKGLREAIAYFLDADVLQIHELDTFMIDQPGFKDKLENSINREDIAFYLGQILNKELNGKIDSKLATDLASLKDAEKITEKYRPYVSLLVENKVVSGDDNRNFNPKDSITRAEFSKLMCEAINVMESKKKADTQTLRAEIKKVNEEDRKITFLFVDKQLEKVRNIAEDVKITINKEKASIGDLKEGMFADVVYYKNAIAEVRAEKISEETKLLGVVDRVDYNKRKLTYKESPKAKSTKELEFVGDIKVYLDKKEVPGSSIRAGQMIEVKYKNDKIIALELTSKKKIFTGVITEINKSDDTITLKNDDFTSNFKIPASSKIRNNGKSEVLANLKTGNKGVLTSEYGKIVKLEVFPNVKSGVINGVFRGDANKNSKNSIEVLYGSDETVTYPVGSDVKILINGKPANQVFDLKVNSNVNLTFDGEDLIQIDARSYGSKISLTGYVKSIDKDDKMIVVEALNNTLANSEFTYDLSLKNAVIVDKKGRKGELSDVKEWQKVFFYGTRELDSDEESIVKVEKLIILENADGSDQE